MPTWLQHLPVPTIWAGITFVLGAGLTCLVAILALRKYGPLQAKALEGLVKVYEKQIDAHEHALEMQKAHYEEELRILRQERDEYRKVLHEKRDEWNNESVKMQLLIQELEGRPNMTNLNTTMEKVVMLIETVSENVAKVAESLDKHDKSIDTRMKEFVKIIQRRRSEK